MKNALVDGLINPRRQWSCIQALPFFFFFFTYIRDRTHYFFCRGESRQSRAQSEKQLVKGPCQRNLFLRKKKREKIQWDKSSKCLRLTRYLVIVGIVKAEFVRPFQAYQISVVLIRRRQVQKTAAQHSESHHDSRHVAVQGPWRWFVR